MSMFTWNKNFSMFRITPLVPGSRMPAVWKSSTGEGMREASISPLNIFSEQMEIIRYLNLPPTSLPINTWPVPLSQIKGQLLAQPFSLLYTFSSPFTPTHCNQISAWTQKGKQWGITWYSRTMASSPRSPFCMKGKNDMQSLRELKCCGGNMRKGNVPIQLHWMIWAKNRIGGNQF